MKRFFLVFLIFLVFVSCKKTSNLKGQKINVIYMAQAGYQPDDIRRIADDFEKKTGVEVNFEFVKYDEQFSKVERSATSLVSTYDVFSLDLIWTAYFAEKGYCVDMTDKVAEVALDIPPAIIDAFRYKGSTWAMPFLANFQLFFYNKDYLKKAGFSTAPATLEEMTEQMKKMKELAIVEYPWHDSWNQKEGLICEYVWLTAAFGGDTFDIAGNPVFNNGPGVKALDFMKMLLNEGLASPASLNSDEPMAKDAFISGECAFNSNWTFQYAQMKDSSVSKVVDSAEMGLLPVSKEITGKFNNNTVSVSGFQGLGILSNSEKKDAAWEYIKYVTSAEIQKQHLEEMPIWKSVQDDPEVQKKDPVMDIKAKQIASVHHRPKVVNYPEISTIMQKYIYAALNGEYESKEALDKAVKEIKPLL